MIAIHEKILKQVSFQKLKIDLLYVFSS